MWPEKTDLDYNSGNSNNTWLEVALTSGVHGSDHNGSRPPTSEGNVPLLHEILRVLLNRTQCLIVL
jgi:hypothetical protein